MLGVQFFQCAQCLFGYGQGEDMGRTEVGQKQLLLEHIDLENETAVHDIAFADANERLHLPLEHIVYQVFDAGQADQQHDLAAVGEHDVGIVAIGFKIGHIGQVHPGEFVPCVEQEARAETGFGIRHGFGTLLKNILRLRTETNVQITSPAYTQKRGASLSLVPRYKGLRIARIVETSNAESPTPMYIYRYTHRDGTTYHGLLRIYIIHPLGRFRCFVLDNP